MRLSSSRVGKVVVATIEPNKDLLESLEEIARREGIKAGIVLSVVGSLKRAYVRNLKEFPKRLPVKDKERMWKLIEGRPSEILSVDGNVHQREGRIEVHAHITLSTVVDDEVYVFGGHLVRGNITFINVEVVMAELEGIEMVREVHPKRKTRELRLKKAQAN